MISIYDKADAIESLNETAGKPLDAKGITIHYTAERDLDDVLASLKIKKLGYHIIIERDGKVTQFASFDKRIAHSGWSEWEGISPNSNHIAVALCSWGWLRKINLTTYVSWCGTNVPIDDVIKKKMWDQFYWDRATNAQLVSLEKLLHWLIDQGIDPKNICGHDECAIPLGRKADPGGILPFTMTELRTRLAEK